MKKYIISLIALLVIGVTVGAALKLLSQEKVTEQPPVQKEKPKRNNFEKPAKCGIENCHGLEIRCGENVPDFCTEIYELGDRCRKWASCEMKEGKCQPKPSAEFENCKSCLEKCKEQARNDSIDLFRCESEC